ncbi:MAG: PAS domain-containing sensor histidine kinase [Thaumarchaeota archaeon]|nr:PAS domain-containing sensor histidine kinase [Nitrososphaerota archaeon]
MTEFDDILKALDDSAMVTILNQDGKITYANKMFCDITKYSNDELIGKDPRIIFKSDHPQEFYDKIWSQLKNGQIFRGEIKNHAKDGTPFWSFTTIVPFLGKDGQPSKFIAIRKEITDRVNAEEKLKQALKQNEEQLEELKQIDLLKDQFASMVTHELKTPLVPIKGYCTMLKQDDVLGKLNAEQKDAVNEIEENSTRLEKLINDILDAHKLDMQKMKFNKENFDVSELVQKILTDLSFMAKEKQVELLANSSINEKITLYSDRSRIRQVIENLVKNAMDFVPEKTGKIEIGVNNEGSSTVFFVKDNGIGISAKNQDSLFKKFYQVDTSYKRKHGGTGLGLAICKGIVEGLDGKIWVNSAEGQGSSFYFSFPREQR